jgi:IS605 OrfB family transposase
VITQQAFRYELIPNSGQRVLLAKHAGTARFTWNWALSERMRRYRECKDGERFTNAIEQHRELNARKATEWAWMYEVSKCAPQEVLRDLDRAFRNFVRARRAGRYCGFPRFKQKGIDDAFRLTGSLRVAVRAVQLPRLGRLRTKEGTDFLHKLSTTLAKTKSVVVLEDLNVSGMVRNRHLARHIADAGWGAFRRMLEYKSRWYGSKVVVAPRFLATSKRCSGCGHVLDALALSVRKWVCPACGVEHDRDGNAARNLVVWSRLATGSSPGINACGEPSGGAEAHASASHGSAKQESAVEDLSIG